ncbi:MAG: hypothetical protein Fur0020_13950 [Thermodesulfovibrionia bacterium]
MTGDGGTRLKPISIQRGEVVLPLMTKMREKGITEELKNFLKGLPSMIRQNGLGQTIAFLRTKEDKKEIADILANVLMGNGKNSKDLINGILNSDVKRYIIMQREAIEYAGWIKRFAIAFYNEGGYGVTTSE